ncbi:hypothetical protein Q8F55_004794 [Vanrija albida]|uniref:Uncharacterized protein n=1 Tax=Vanrija albida TaxID=181172 RepID=A0ABR3Q061_9TREE
MAASNNTAPDVLMSAASIRVPTLTITIKGSSDCYNAVCGHAIGRNTSTSSCFGMPSTFNDTIPAALAGGKCASMGDIDVAWQRHNRTGNLVPFISNTYAQYPYKCTFTNGACAGQICNFQAQPSNATGREEYMCWSDPVIAMPPPWLPRPDNMTDSCFGPNNTATCEHIAGRDATTYSAAPRLGVPTLLMLLGVSSAALGLLGGAAL